MAFLQHARTILRDIAFGRTSVHVIRETDLQNSAAKPIFLLGCFRSGTSLLRLILDSHPNLNCPPETKFLLPIAGLLEEPAYLQGAVSLGYDIEFVRAQFAGLFRSFHVGNMLAHKKKRWIDKTPDYVTIVPFLEWLFGQECQFILLYRHGLDVAKSMTGLGPGPVSIEDHEKLEENLEFWMRASRAMKDLEGRRPSQCFPLRYEDLCAIQEPLVRELLAFLGEPWDDNVMQWHKKGHETQGGMMDKSAMRTIGFQPNIGSHRTLPQDLQDRLLGIARGTLAELGYGT